MVKRKISLFCYFFFPFGNKDFGGVSYLAGHTWAENLFLLPSFLKIVFSSGKGHLNMSRVHSKHGMFRECNCLLT